ncbi:MAG: S9 family peptidase [Candidatus Zixiibacteriota bacterium]|nr:MAG: S9 family peptidase [candidate division Zixibacteria bacterium]
MRRLLIPLMLALLALTASAAEPFTVELLFTHPYVTGTAPNNLAWSPNGQRLAFTWNEGGDRFRDLYLAEASGRIIRLSDLQDLPRDARAKDERTPDEIFDETDLDNGVSSPVWQRDGKTLWFAYRGDLFRVEAKAGARPERVFHTQEGEGHAAFSRDGRWMAYTADKDIFARETATGRTVQLTRDGSDDRRNGGGAYDTYLEGVFWAPDSRKLAFIQYDVTGFDKLLIPDYTGKKVEVTKQQREIAGGRLPGIKLGIVNPDSAWGLPLWVNLPDTAQYYIRSLDWSPDGSRLLLEVLPRTMQERFLLLADAATGKVDTVWHEADFAWIPDNMAQARFGPEGESVVFCSEASGWCHFYLLPLDGSGEPRQLTSGAWEVEKGWTTSYDRRSVFFTSSEESTAERHLYRLDLPAGSRSRLSDEPGWISSFALPEGGSKAAVIFGDMTRPYDLYLASGRAEKPLARLTHSPTAEFARYDWFPPEYIEIPTSDGKSFPAKLWLPRNGRKPAPLVVYIHGAGYAQNVDRAPWGWDDKYHRLLAQEGLAVVDIDYRGSSGYGRDWRVDIYRHTGGKDLDDAISAARYCVQQGWADSTRVGIWGWSYGGFLTNMAMFRAGDVFLVGCSVAAPNDWKNYNLWYTTQRFTFPEQDSAAYAQSSPITFAGGLQGDLLIVHGLQDDNVHAQDTIQLIDRLISLGKRFDMLLYPREDHGFQRDASDVHVFRSILEYLQEHLVDGGEVEAAAGE